LVQVCPAVAPQFFTTWALQAQYATYAHAFLLSFFVAVENKRLVKPTPKPTVARGNRVGGTTLRKSSNFVGSSSGLVAGLDKLEFYTMLLDPFSDSHRYHL